jgi:hypothetical protein
MENGDREKILREAKRNAQLRRLYSEHIALEEELSRFSKRPYLTATEEQEETLLKRRKLQGVDLMMSLLSVETVGAQAH